jgi:hypothetical protein
MSENSGAGFIKYVAALGGFAVGWAIGSSIALNLAVPKDSLLGRSAQAGESPVGALLQWGLGEFGAVVAFLLVKGRVDK